MKKKLFILFFIITSIFIFTNKVNAETLKMKKGSINTFKYEFESQSKVKIDIQSNTNKDVASIDSYSMIGNDYEVNIIAKNVGSTSIKYCFDEEKNDSKTYNSCYKIDVLVTEDSNYVTESGCYINGEKNYNYFYQGDYGIEGWTLYSNDITPDDCRDKNYTKVSILGDSISTYKNYSGYNDTYTEYGVGKNNIDNISVNDTWWMQLINSNSNMKLEVNNSMSGSTVTNSVNNVDGKETSNSKAIDRVASLGNPDVIYFYMGTNDYLLNGRFGITTENFGAEYNKVLDEMQRLYPNATIYCMTVADSGKGNDINGINNAIRTAASNHNVKVIDTASIINTGNTSDGIHPNANGMKSITATVASSSGFSYSNSNNQNNNQGTNNNSNSQTPSGIDTSNNINSNVPIKSMSSLTVFDEALTIDSPTTYTENSLCTKYIVSLTGTYDIPNPITGVNKFKDYRAVPNCSGYPTDSYDAFCIDPAVIGPDSRGWDYTLDGTVDMNSNFGKSLYALYTEYYNSQNNYNVNFEMTQAVRLLITAWDDSYDFLGRQNGPYRKHAESYYSAGVSGIAATIKAKVENGEVKPKTINVNLSKLDSSVTGDNFTAKFNLSISGVSENVSINDSNLTLTATTESGQEVNASISSVEWQNTTGTTRNAIIYVNGNGSGACNVNVAVGVEFYDPGDIKNILIVRATKKNMAQRMLVFLKGNIISGDSSSVLASDNTNCSVNNNNACIPSVDFTCGKDYTQVVEGTPTGTDTVNWNSCIFGDGKVTGVDPAGNSYTVQEQNRYCSVACKEDYAFRFPGNINSVPQGRYLSFNVDNVYHAVTGVASQRTCVTSEILVDSYINEAAIQKGKMLTQLNAYYYYKAMLEELKKDEVKNRYLDTHSSPVVVSSSQPSNVGCSATPPTLSDVYDWYPEFKNVSFKYTQYKFANQASNLALLKSGIVLDGAELSKVGTTGKAIIEGSETGTVLENNDGPKSTDTAPGTYQTKTSSSSCTSWNVYEKALFDNSDGNKLEQYNLTLERVNTAIEAAKDNYEAARRTLEDYTNQINACTTWELDYKFDPEIDFNYAESSYIDMMQGNTKLQMIDKENVKVNETKYYCSSNTTVEGVVGCSNTPSEVSSTYVPANDIENPTNGHDMNYYNYKRIGVIDKYGDPSVSISGAKSNPTFIYFKPVVAFYTYPNKGIVTTTDDKEHTEPLDIGGKNYCENQDAEYNQNADGLVYPISIQTKAGVYNYSLTYRNIGQYYNSSGNLGRIMGDRGYLTGEAKNELVCTYEVCNFTDPNCDTTPDFCNQDCDPTKEVCGSCDPEKENCTCDQIKSSRVCNYGNLKDMSDSLYSSSCAKELLNNNCCDYVDESRIELGEADLYNSVCPKQYLCTGFEIITASSSSDNTNITDNGDLQFVVRTVSLNNLFPNGIDNAGTNWQGSTSGAENKENPGQSQDLTDIIGSIESKGESVYGSESEYSFVLTPACMKKIQEYNKVQEKEDYGLSDYTLTLSNYNKDDNSQFFDYMMASGCTVNINH